MVICTAPAAMFATIALASRMKRTSDRKSTRLNSSHLVISYAVFCLKKKTPLYNDLVPEEDAEPVLRLTAPGAIVVAKTYTRPSATGVNTHNTVFVAIRHPWYRALTL